MDMPDTFQTHDTGKKRTEILTKTKNHPKAKEDFVGSAGLTAGFREMTGVPRETSVMEEFAGCKYRKKSCLLGICFVFHSEKV